MYAVRGPWQVCMIAILTNSSEACATRQHNRKQAGPAYQIGSPGEVGLYEGLVGE